MKSKKRYNIFNKTLAFTLIEVLLTLLIMSAVTAIFAPVLTKKLSSAVTNITQREETSTTDTSCKPSENCASPNASDCTKCTLCRAGYYLSSSGCYACTPGYYCNGNTRIACTSPSYSEIYNASQCSVQEFNESHPGWCKTFKTNAKGCQECNSGYYLYNNTCYACSIENCKTYKSPGTSTGDSTCKCNTCNDGYNVSSDNKKCIDTYAWCNTSKGLLKIAADLGTGTVKNYCITQYNVGDGPAGSGYEASDMSKLVTLVPAVPTSSGTRITEDACWKGYDSNTAQYCNDGKTGVGSYSGCKRTVCTWWAGNVLCPGLDIGGVGSFRLPSLTELKNLKPSTYMSSTYAGNKGLMYCSSNNPTIAMQCNRSAYACNGAAYTHVGDYGNCCYARKIYANNIYLYNSYYRVGYAGYEKDTWGYANDFTNIACSIRCIKTLD